MKFVLDASAVLALLWNEPGADRVAETLGAARVSAVNLAELVAKLIDRGASEREAIAVLESLSIDAVAFDVDQACASGLLRAATRASGLSLGDRACLALARRDGAVALTADRAWSRIDCNVEIEVIR